MKPSALYTKRCYTEHGTKLMVSVQHMRVAPMVVVVVVKITVLSNLL